MGSAACDPLNVTTLGLLEDIFDKQGLAENTDELDCPYPKVPIERLPRKLPQVFEIKILLPAELVANCIEVGFGGNYWMGVVTKDF